MHGPRITHWITMLLLALTAATPTQAVQAPTERQSWYYEIGGAEPISAPANPAASSITLGAGASLNLGYSCGRFDLTASVSNLFNNVTSSLQNTLISSAQGALASLPLYIVQRSLPGLYELFQSYAVDFKRTFDLSQQSCEAYERDILAGKDPYAGWVSLAKGESWKAQMATGNDAVAAKTAVESAGGNGGVTWIGGTKAAGAGQVPVEVIRDTSQAGWNMELNRTPTDTSPYVPSGAPPRLAELFARRTDAGDYAVRVLGDQIIRTCDGCTRQAIAGHGLLPEYERERTTVASNLGAIVASAGVPAHASLEQVAAPGVGITAKVIQTLRTLPPDERSIMAGRLAAEVALARTAERTLAIRRLLLTARRDPNVQGNDEAQRIIERSIAELEREVDNILYEVRVRREIASSTAAVLIARDNELRGEGASTGRQPRPEGVHLDEGGRFQ